MAYVESDIEVQLVGELEKEALQPFLPNFDEYNRR